MVTFEHGPSANSWGPGWGLHQGTDVVGKGLVLCKGGGVCWLVWLLTDVVVIVANPLFAAAALGSGQPRP